jgi:hypothetical protein
MNLVENQKSTALHLEMQFQNSIKNVLVPLHNGKLRILSTLLPKYYRDDQIWEGVVARA